MHFGRLLLPSFLTLCAAVLAWWLLSGYVPVSPVRSVPAVTVQFDGKQAMQYLDELTHRFKGRVVGSAQGFAAAGYVAGQFRSYGLKVETQDFREAGVFGDGTGWGWYKGQNVIGILPGRGKGTVVMTAHRDCVRKAPEGAYDDGSGTAAVLELARVLAAGGPYRYTYAFAALDGEEIGLGGSRVLMNNRPAALQDIRLMVNLDMVGFKGNPRLGVAHTQYLSPETRALVASRFNLPRYILLLPMQGRGTDAQIYVLRGLATIDVHETMPMFTRIANHSAEDTADQVSAESIQRAGRAVEQLVLQGDAMGAFTPTHGLEASNGAGILPHWRYLLGGICIFAVLAIPLLLRLRPVPHGGRAALTMAALTLFTGILAALSTRWHGGIAFVALPILGTIAFVALQVVALRRMKSADPGLGRILVASVPSFLFAGTWWLTGLWSLGFWLAASAYLPAVAVTWKPGAGWRIFDIAFLLPGFLLTWFVGLAAWLLAPSHMFPPAKLSVFAALCFAAALAGIWGIFGRRPAPRALDGTSGFSGMPEIQKPYLPDEGTTARQEVR